MNRNSIYTIIDGERDYQDERWPRPAHNHSVTEYLVYIDHYIHEAFKKLSTEAEIGSFGDSLVCLRKIAALAVAAMEEHGASPR